MRDDSSKRSGLWVIGNLIGSLIYTVLTHTFLERRRHRFQWDEESRAALFHFGRWVFVSTVLTFFAGQTDRLIFGKMIPLALFGVYNIALMMAGLPGQVVTKIGSAIAFPAFSRLNGAGRNFESAFFRIRLPLLMLGAWATAILIASGPALVNTPAGGQTNATPALDGWCNFSQLQRGCRCWRC